MNPHRDSIAQRILAVVMTLVLTLQLIPLPMAYGEQQIDTPNEETTASGEDEQQTATSSEDTAPSDEGKQQTDATSSDVIPESLPTSQQNPAPTPEAVNSLANATESPTLLNTPNNNDEAVQINPTDIYTSSCDVPVYKDADGTTAKAYFRLVPNNDGLHTFFVDGVYYKTENGTKLLPGNHSAALYQAETDEDSICTYTDLGEPLATSELDSSKNPLGSVSYELTAETEGTWNGYLLVVSVDTSKLTSEQIDDIKVWAHYRCYAIHDGGELSLGEEAPCNLSEYARTEYTFTPQEDGVYSFALQAGTESELDEPLTVALDSNRKVIATSAGRRPSLTCSLKKGVTYRFTVGKGEPPESGSATVLVTTSEKGTTSLRIAAINGQEPAVAGDYPLVPVGATVTLEAQIPVSELVTKDGESASLSHSKIRLNLSGANLDEATALSVYLGNKELAKDEPISAEEPNPTSVCAYLQAGWNSGYSPQFELTLVGDAATELSKRAPNEMLTVQLTCQTSTKRLSINTFSAPNYLSWGSSGLLEESMVYCAEGLECDLYLDDDYSYSDDSPANTVLAMYDTLTFIVMLTDVDGHVVDCDVDEDGQVSFGDEKVGTLQLVSADGKTTITPGEPTGLTEGFGCVLGSAGRYMSDCPVTFTNIEPGDYTLKFESTDDKYASTNKSLRFSRDSSKVSDQNELGFVFMYDGEEIPFQNYGRFLAVGEGASSSSIMPSLPLGTLNGAAALLPVFATTSPVSMKVHPRDGGNYADACTAAYGQTVEFKTTAALEPVEDDWGYASFEYAFPIMQYSEAGMESEGDYEQARPFEIAQDDIKVLLDGKVLTSFTGDESASYDYELTYEDNCNPSSYHSGYEPDNNCQTIRIEVTNDELFKSGGDLEIIIPATLTGSVSCGGYGNSVRLTADVNGEVQTDWNIVYTGTFILQSITKDGNVLPGARFKLTKEGDNSLTVASTQGLSRHAVPQSVIDGGSDDGLVSVGHVATQATDDQGEWVDDTYASLSYAGVDQGTYQLHETTVPAKWHARVRPITLELEAHVPSVVVTGSEYCRWSVKLNGEPVPELLRYQRGLLDPLLPREAYRESVVAYSCQSSTIVLKAMHIPNNLTARVVWDDEGLEAERPSQLTVQLLKNGKASEAPVVLSGEDADPWEHTWESLDDADARWTISESFDGLLTENDGDADGETSSASAVTPESARTRQYVATYSDIVYSDDNAEATITVTNKPRLFVDFDSAGGSSVASQTVTKDEAATSPAEPTRDGYTFAGWYLGDQAYDFSMPITSDMTLVARWTNNDGSSGDDKHDEQTASGDKAAPASSKAPGVSARTSAVAHGSMPTPKTADASMAVAPFLACAAAALGVGMRRRKK